jgi:hypothetical protein
MKFPFAVVQTCSSLLYLETWYIIHANRSVCFETLHRENVNCKIKRMCERGWALTE